VSVLSVFGRLLGQLAGRRVSSPLTREQALEARPVRNPSLKWRLNEEDGVEIIVPRRSDRLGRVLGYVFYVPTSRPVVLDEVGSRVWHLCDGERTVAEIVQMMCDEYKLGKREVEVSLTEYLRTLGKRGMIGFLVTEELARELGEEGKDLVGLPGVGGTRGDLETARLEQAEESAQEAEQETREPAAGEGAAEQGDEDGGEAPASENESQD
jgi:hypothetical protein